tara:strand:+ start:265 stop:672 length:408 start_codon:yes stop_codon:yes gene_type:complete
MKSIKKLLIPLFHIANLVMIIFYLYPGSIFGCFLYNNCAVQPKITSDIMISSNLFIASNHFFVFILLSILGVLGYGNTKKNKFLFVYLFLLSIILELLQIIVPVRAFEWSDLFGNILGVTLVIIIYKIKVKYVQN